jgi:hypothetical protein
MSDWMKGMLFAEGRYQTGGIENLRANGEYVRAMNQSEYTKGILDFLRNKEVRIAEQ